MYGLVLEGGGAKGSYHMGVYKAILECGIDLGGVVGTSIGALNGAMIVQNEFERCHELWNKITYSMVLDVDDEEFDKVLQSKFIKEDLSFLSDKLKKLMNNRGFDITPLKKLMDEYINEEKIRASKMDFGIVTINLTQRKPLYLFKEDIQEGEIKDYLMASAYLPFFKSERIGGSIYLDGGFYDNLPFKMLLDKGYNDLIMVRTHARGFTKKLNLEGKNAIVISPSDNIGRSIEYSSQGAKRNINLGYYDGLRALKGLSGYKYCIKPETDDFYLDFLLSVSENQVREIESILKLHECYYKRSLLEVIIPKICVLLAIGKECSYEDLLIYLLEKKAEILDIEKKQIYTFNQLLNEVKGKNIEFNKEQTSKIDKIIGKVDIISVINREEAILKIADILF